MNDRGGGDRIHSAERYDAQLLYLLLCVLIHLIWCHGSVPHVLNFQTTTYEMVILKDMIN